MTSEMMVIDCLEVALAGQELVGSVNVAQLARLADNLYDAEGVLTYRVLGSIDGRQRPRISLSVNGEINLECQRCLGSLQYPVAVESSLLVLTAGGPTESVGIDDLDGVAAGANTEVWALVEDEVLLAIPFAARHAEGQCSTVVDSNIVHAESPFSVLAKLKRN